MLPAAPYRDGADGQHSLQPARRPLLRRFRRGVAAVARAVHPRDDARVAGADARPLVSGADAPSVRDLQLQPQTRLASRTLRSEEHTSELQSLMRISYAVFCLKKKTQKNTNTSTTHKTSKTYQDAK